MVNMKGDSRLDGLRSKLESIQGSEAHGSIGSVVPSTQFSWAQNVADTSGTTSTSVHQTYTMRVTNNQAGSNAQGFISGASRGLRPSTPVGPASSIGIGGLSVANKGSQWGAMKKFHYSEEYEGVAFSAVTHEQHYRQTKLDPGDLNHTESNFRIANSNFRKLVVLRQFKHHCIALPIKTHEGHGLANKNANRNEFVSIRDGNFRSTAAPAESSHGILWATLYSEFYYESPWHKMNDNCCLQITAPYSHNLQLKSSISGKFKAESMNRLRQLFREIVSGDKRTRVPRPGAVELHEGIMEDNVGAPTGPRAQYRQKLECWDRTSPEL